jgi:hypothetical protein
MWPYVIETEKARLSNDHVRFDWAETRHQLLASNFATKLVELFQLLHKPGDADYSTARLTVQSSPYEDSHMSASKLAEYQTVIHDQSTVQLMRALVSERAGVYTAQLAMAKRRLLRGRLSHANRLNGFYTPPELQAQLAAEHASSSTTALATTAAVKGGISPAEAANIAAATRRAVQQRQQQGTGSSSSYAEQQLEAEVMLLFELEQLAQQLWVHVIQSEIARNISDDAAFDSAITMSSIVKIDFVKKFMQLFLMKHKTIDADYSTAVEFVWSSPFVESRMSAALIAENNSQQTDDRELFLQRVRWLLREADGDVTAKQQFSQARASRGPLASLERVTGYYMPREELCKLAKERDYSAAASIASSFYTGAVSGVHTGDGVYAGTGVTAAVKGKLTAVANAATATAARSSKNTATAAAAKRTTASSSSSNSSSSSGLAKGFLMRGGKKTKTPQQQFDEAIASDKNIKFKDLDALMRKLDSEMPEQQLQALLKCEKELKADKKVLVNEV